MHIARLIPLIAVIGMIGSTAAISREREAAGKVWVAVLAVYAAPPGAVDWPGPWESGMAKANEDKLFKTEAECRNFAIGWIGRIHQAMLAPIRFQCVPFPAGLPKGAPR